MKEENYKEIFERLKERMSAKSDADVARGLGVSPQALSTFKKQGKFPSDLLIKYCLVHQLSIDWLLTGEGQMKRGKEEKPSMVCEKPVIYNNVKGDPEMAEIVQMLRESPQDKKLVLKLLKGKKDIKEALEGFEIAKIKEQDG